MLLYLFIRCVRRKVTIKGENYTIRVEYGNILKKKKCKRLIHFDECFTTDIGNQPEQIKETSLCGQYLKEHECLNIPKLIEEAKLKPLDEKSRFKEKTKYQSGKMLPYKNDVCIPVLGAGITRFESASGESYTPQELLNLMILSYKLSSYKIKAPYKLRIISKRTPGISLDRIDV